MLASCVTKWIVVLCATATLAVLALLARGEPTGQPADFQPDIPKVWVDEVMAGLEVPLAKAQHSPKHISADYYYRIPVRGIYKTYPVYHPGREPPRYLQWLQQQEPEKVWDGSKLKTKEAWIQAGAMVFDAPITTGSLGPTPVPELYLRKRQWYEHTQAPLTKDGELPFYRYVIKEKGKVEIGILSCAMCHTRVEGGLVIQGAQGNFPFGRAFGYDYRSQAPVEVARALERFLYGAPWVQPNPQVRLDQMSAEEIAAVHETVPAGVLARHRASPSYPVQVPDLIGIENRKYLDRSGLQRHRGLGDLMRYAALNQGGDDLASFGSFRPAEVFGGKFPEPRDPNLPGRYSDEQLYALALYVYSLKPPANPHQFDALAARGKQIFEGERCGGCHTPPLYTNNQLLPVKGFEVPDEHRAKYDISSRTIDTDPGLTLKTRRGTGYYKVPSLRGLWYRGPFLHDGSLATLEEVFDPRRLEDTYEATGFRPVGVKARAVKGHAFGLQLPDEDKRALIAFLKTL